MEDKSEFSVQVCFAMMLNDNSRQASACTSLHRRGDEKDAGLSASWPH